MVFNKELSQAEVTALYNGTSGVEELQLVYPSVVTDDAVDVGWRYIAVTYEGQNDSAGTATDDVIIYVDGAAVSRMLFGYYIGWSQRLVCPACNRPLRPGRSYEELVFTDQPFYYIDLA
ncbi:unnamed protein product [marine sediment metagenome]|uniref:Uncharacterized protein n=1 Tax=marine sediment metagenome TaxID=412755 RepID=X1DZ44_9ZZZZ